MSVLALIAVVVGAAVLRHLILTRGRAGAPAAAEWLRTHRSAHIALLVVFLAMCVSFPWWRDGDEPVDVIVAVAGAAGAAFSLAAAFRGS